MENESRQWLYKALTDKGYNVGKDFNEFNSLLSNNADSRKWAYETASGLGYNVGKDYDEFESLINPQPQISLSDIATQAVDKVREAGKAVGGAVTEAAKWMPDVSQKKEEEKEKVSQPQFEPLDIDKMNRDNLRRMRGENTWKEESPVVDPQTGKPVEKPNDKIKDAKDAILGDKDAAKSTGFDKSLEQLRDEVDYYRETGKELRNPIDISFMAPTVARDEQGNLVKNENGQVLTGLTTDENRVSVYQNQEKERRERQVKEVTDRLIADVVARADEELKKNAPKAEMSTFAGAQAANLRAINEATGPESLLELLNKKYGFETPDQIAKNEEELRKQGKSVYLSDKGEKYMDFANRFLNDNRDIVERAAEELGVPVEDYVLDNLMPQLGYSMAEQFYGRMEDKYAVKNAGDYLTRKMSNSVLGTLASMGTNTKMQRQMMQEELMKTEEGEGKYHNAGFWERLGGTTAMFASDGPPLMATGKVGVYSAKAIGKTISLMGRKELGAIVATGSPFLAANVGRITKYGGMIGGQMARGVGSMGTFMGGSSAIQDLSVGDGTLASVGKAMLSGAWEGTKFGLATGVFGPISGELGSKIGRVGEHGAGLAAKRVAYDGAAFLVENQIFAGLDYISNPEDFNWTESTLDAFYMQMGSKFSSVHGLKGLKDSFARLFAPKKAEPIRLDDTDKMFIQRAFGGMDFAEIASDVNNIGKILEDKQNIPWVTRQKVSGYTTKTFDSSRPRTSDINIDGTNKLIKEVGEDGELIQVHQYKDVDDLMEIRQQIEERRQNDDMLSDFALLSAVKTAQPTQMGIDNAKTELKQRSIEAGSEIPDADLEPGGKSYDAVLDIANKKANWGREIVEQFADECGMKADEMLEIMKKKPIDRKEDEQDLMFELAKRLHDAAYPRGEKHTSQSRIDGENQAGNSEVMNPDTAIEISKEYQEAEKAYYGFLAQHQDMAEKINDLTNKGARLDDIYLYVEQNYSGSERDELLGLIADYANATAKREGYINKTGRNIDESVSQELDSKSFHGTIDETPDADHIITFVQDGQRYTLLNGNVGLSLDGLTIDPDKSGGLIIALDENGQFVKLKPSADMVISEIMPKQDYGERLRNELQVAASQTAIETGLVETKQGGALDNAGGKEGTETGGENNPSAAAPQASPEQTGGQPVANQEPATTQPAQDLAQKIADVTDKNGVKHYEKGIGADEAIADLQADGIDPAMMADAMVRQAQKTIEKWASKKEPTPEEIVKGSRESKEAQSAIDYWSRLKERYTEQQKEESNLNVAPESPVVPENNVTLQPTRSKTKNKTADEKRADRIKELKEQYGEDFDDDFSYAQTAEELASMYVGRNRTLSRESIAKELGYPIGINTEEPWAETLLAKKGEGVSTWDVAHAAWQSDENPIVDNEGNRKFNDQEIHDALITVFQNAKQKSDIMDYPINRREEIAREKAEEAKRRDKEAKEANEKPIELSEEDITRIVSELPFEGPHDEDIPESHISALERTARELMKEEGAPHIEVIDTERVSADGWRKMAEESTGAFLSEEDVLEFKEACLREGIFFNEETGKVTVMRVYSENVTPENLREAVELYKKYKNGDLHNEERRDETEGSLTAGVRERVRGDDKEEAREGGDGRPSEASPEPERPAGESESSERDEYLKPRNDKEKQIVSDVESKLAEEIKAAEEEVRKAKSALEKAKVKESDRATDIFANDETRREPDQIFSSEEMGLDTSAEGVEKRTRAEREAVAAAEQRLEKLKSQAEHDSRVRGALDNERRQTSIEDADKRIDERQKEEYEKYIEPLLGKSDEELRQMAEKKEKSVGGDLKKLAGDKEYSAIQNVLVQREIDRQKTDAKAFIGGALDDGDVTFVDKATREEIDELNRLIEKHGVEDSEGKIEEYVNRLRKKYPVSKKDSNPVESIEKAAQEFKEEKKEQDKQLGITHEETPEQKADRERAEKLADTPLTDAEVDSSSASDVQKTLAKAYLNGNHGLLQEAAYLNVYNDVRNRRQDSKSDSSDAGSKPQLDSPANSGEQRPGRVGGSDLGVAETESAGQDEGRQLRVENGEGQLHSADGKRSDRGVSGEESAVDGVHTGRVEPERGSESGKQRPDVREGLSAKGGSGDSGKPTAGSDAAIAASKQRLAELRKKFKDAGRNGTLSVSLAGMNNEQIGILGEIITESANLGYQYISKGLHEFSEWRKQMLDDFHDWLQEDMKWKDSEIDEYIQEVWNCEYNINGVTRTIGEWASFIGQEKLREVVREDLGTKFEKQKAAESVETKVGDIENIRESLPYLLPEQQDDVLKAETQFFNEQHQDREHGFGKGMMFTNGTGTGKTYTGLGIVKRFVKQGKGRVLILTPSQEKVTDWRKDGLNLGLEIESLDEEAKNLGTSATKSKGKGVVVTTYANARQNLALLEDCFDLIVYDESHKIAENKEGERTTMQFFHEMLTNKNVERSIDRQTYWLPEWIEHRNLLKEREENRERLDVLNNYDDNETVKVDGKDVVVAELKANLNARMRAIENRLEELRPIMQEIRESKRPQAEIDSKRTKTVFLSATPFNVRESLRYAEGYLFSYPEEDKNTIGSYNHRSPEDAFMEQTFPAGYRWRYGRLELHVENQEALGRQEIDFSDYLQNTLQTMSGRMIASDYDYSRDFPVLTLDHAGRFNQAMSEVYRNKRYSALAEAFRKAFDYNYSTALFEAMKTSLVNDRIKEHLKRGHKVVVFHRRRTSGDLEPPFRRALDMASIQASAEPDPNVKGKILAAIKAFESDFSDMLEWEKTLDYTLPRDQIEKVFGKKNVAFFSGAETKGVKHKSVEDFMRDNGGKDIIVIQEASGKEGISLHDQTGQHQRVEINLALPQSPIAFIQIEGRIYRIGQKSNAIFEYPLLGLDLETNLFAQKFNDALGTTENLALGSKARNLRKSIANSVLENTGEVDYDRQGLGGKDMDGRVDQSDGKDGFDNAITDYYGNQKMQRGRDNREGVDYFPTPEPIGYKMVEFAQMLDGETALEPSAGHGAIARYVPETNGMTAIEPSASLFTKLQMRAGGPGRRFEDMPFEDYPLANKHDVVLMNPPYGVGGKTAMEHVAKAFKHLKEGGRIVAIIPDGPAMEKRFDAWLVSEGMNGAAVVTGEVKLPDVAFGRAGTNVRTRIVVIDKVSRAEMRKNMPQKVTVDLSGEQSIAGLFDRIRNVRMPERTIDQVAINTKKALRTRRALEDNPFCKEFYIDGNYLYVKSRSKYEVAEIRLNLEKPMMENVLSWYKNFKSTMENPEKLDYGKYVGKVYGKGAKAVPAIDAIKEFCRDAIKTLENVTGVAADQMDKTIREQEAERERREKERMAEIERLQKERARERQEKIDTIKRNIEEGFTGEGIYNDVEQLKRMVDLYHSRTSSFFERRRAEFNLKQAGFDPETGKKIEKNEPVNAQTATVSQPSQEEAVNQILDIANRRKAAAPKPADYAYKLDKNTRTNEDMHLVNYNGARLSDVDYRAVERKAKALNGYYNRFKKAWHFKTEEDARKFMESVNVSSDMSEAPVRFSEVKDKETIKKLEEGPKIKVYRAMQMIAGKLYPPMAAKRDGKLVDSIELGKWEKADEHPEMADENGKFKLDKGNGKSLKAAYNPYIHTSTTMLNDQFSEAQSRDNLVVVECEVPESELTSGYKAEKAKDAVGRLEWKAGIIQGQLSGTREVILSRWDKPVRIVPTEEVAKSIANQIKGKVEVMPTNVVTPQQRAELEKLGVEFVETDNRGRIMYGEHEGETYSSVYGKKKGEVRFSEKKDEEKLNNQGEHAESEKKDVTSPENKIDYEETDRERIFAGNEAVMRTVAETSDTRVRDSSTEEVGRGSEPKESLLRSLVQRAQENGTWKDSIDGEVAGYIGEGQENHVYLSKDGQHVIKLNNFNFVPNNATNLSAFIDRLRAHNELFPADAMELLGFTENAKGEVSAIIRQPFVDAEREATDSEIDDYLEERGFTVDMTDEWSNGKYGILDLKPSNVLVDKNGRLRFIDVVVRNMDRQKARTRFKEGGESLHSQHESKILEGAEKLSKKLKTSVKVARNIGEVTNRAAAEAIRAGRQIQGWYDTETREITLYLPHIESSYDAERVVAHEVIGHYGMRELLGEKGYKSYMLSLLMDIKDPSLEKYWKDNLAKNGFDVYRTIDEYLAEAAEKGYGDLSMWQKVRDKVGDALRSIGFETEPSIHDVKYMVWLSKHNLEKKGDVMAKMKREAILWRLGRERYEAKVKNGEFVYDGEKAAVEDTNIPYFPGNGVTLFRHTPSIKNQKLNYERALNRWGYVWKEAHIDQMQAAVELMRSISGVKKIEDIPAAENFVLMENQMASKEEQMDYLFNRDLMKPLDKAVSACLPDMGRGVEQQLRNLQLYMIAKHGLERNRVLYVRDTLRDMRKDSTANKQQIDQTEQDFYDMLYDLRKDLRDGDIDLREYHESVDQWIRQNVDTNYMTGKKDYSGLKGMVGDWDDVEDAVLIDKVMSIEDKLGKERVSDLWEKTRAVSQFGLDMEYEGGLDSKEKHDKVSQMFEWYVPLRGYDETTAEEVYDYLEENGGNGRKWAGPVLMNAKGHEHLSDVDVFATLGAMNSYAISRSLRNQMKQSFARFVREHYNDVEADKRLVTELPYLWAVDKGIGGWEEQFPDIPEGAKADDIAAILEQYEQDMKALEAQGKAKRVRQNSSIPYRPASKEHKAQHIVDVWINGEKHAFIINGNPRAAQAINGQLKAEGSKNILTRFVRGMAQLNTSYSPDFIVGNTERDFIFASTAIGIKENFGYWKRWEKNYFAYGFGRGAAGVPMMHTNLFKRYRNGTLNMNNSTDRYFKEFMENGGETGWVETKNLEKWRDEVVKGVKTQGSLAKAGSWMLKCIPEAIEAANERAENMARFATYLTSRQMGRSITRSVSDAKEVSVNFNRKGAGMKTVNMNKGGNRLERMNAFLAAKTAQFGQDYFMFYNAGVQGLNNAAKLTRDHPIKASTAFAFFMAAGVLIPWLNQSLIDNEDEEKRGVKDPYAELPEWIRRNRLCIYKGKGEFLTFDLPIELRALYGIGDMAAGHTLFPNLKSDKPVWQDMMTQMTQILPIDFMGEHPDQPLLNFVPSTATPLAEAVMNTNWYGRKIEKDRFIDENAPRWKRAYQSTNKAYIGLSKMLNAKTNSYSEEELKALGIPEENIGATDEALKGKADGWLTDPSLLEHIVNGYFGGAGQTVGRLGHIWAMRNEATFKELLANDKMPVFRRLHYSPTDQNKLARTRNRWWKYKEDMDAFNTEIKTLKEQGSIDPIEKMKQISLEDSVRATRNELMNDAYKDYSKMNKRLKKTEDPKEREDIQTRIDQLMENTVQGLDGIEQ